MKQDKKSFQYSKILPLVTGIVFIVCLFFSFKADLTSVVDTTLYATAITISGGIWGSTIVWYSKKAQSENLSKLKIEMYKQSTNERLRYNEQMMKLKIEYEMSDSDIEDIESKNTIAEMNDKALEDAYSSIDEGFIESDSSNEIQSF